MKKNAFFCGLLFISWPLFSQTCIQGVINTYAPVLYFDCENNAVVVDNTAAFSVGNLVLLMQMKGGEVDLTNSPDAGNIVDFGTVGNYEFNRIDQIQGSHIQLKYKRTQEYTPSWPVQIIKVPEYQNITSCDLTCQPWNGTTGGVFAIKVYGTLTMQGNIDVSSKGYRGGTHVNCQLTSNHETDYIFDEPDPNKSSAKGESINILSSFLSNGRGKMATGGGGGNAHNAGGGGGGNGGSGGWGGKEFSHTTPVPNTFGVGGTGMTPHPSKIFMGGGGGSGHTNDFTGTSGGTGGGIAIVIAGEIVANGKKIMANGENVTGGNFNNDGQGGGGAGGTIAVSAPLVPSDFLIEAKGGKGGNSIFLTSPSQKIGPGGGGGGGIAYLYHSTPSLNNSLQGGANGITNQSDPYGAESGAMGIMATNQQLPWDTIPLDVALNYTITPANCNSSNNGAIQIITPASSYQLGGVTTTTGFFNGLLAGNYPVTIFFTPDCSVTDTIEVTTSGFYIDQDTSFLCPGTSVVINQQTWFAPNTVFDTIPSAAACDTIRQHVLITQPLPTLSRQFSFCPGDTLWINGTGFSVPATFIDTLPGGSGCDTVRTTLVRWSELPEYKQITWVCPGEKAYINGLAYSSGALVRDTLRYPETCDTVRIWLVKSYPQQMSDFLPDTAIYCPGDLLQWCSPWTNTQWNDATVGMCYQASDAGTVIAAALDPNGCPLRDTVVVTYCCGPSTIYAPNSFAPGQNPPNDRFTVFTKAECDTYLLRIYDRWGALLFESHEPARFWDGTFRGKDCASGVYVWVLETGQKGQLLPTVMKGNITLLR